MDVLFRPNVLCKLSFFHILVVLGTSLGVGNAWPKIWSEPTWELTLSTKCPGPCPLKVNQFFFLLLSLLSLTFSTWQLACVLLTSWELHPSLSRPGKGTAGGSQGGPSHQRPTPGQAQYLLLKLLPTPAQGSEVPPHKRAQLSRSVFKDGQPSHRS